MGSQRGGTERGDAEVGHEDDAGREGIPTDRVHVRRLDVVDTLRWSRGVLADSLELVGLAFAVGLLSVVTLMGVSPTATPPTEPPRIDGWVWPVYLVFFVGIAFVWGAVYATADAAVEERDPSLADRLRQAASRLPALFVTGVLTWVVSALGFILFVLPGVYLFHRLVLAYPACIIDGTGPVGSLRAGWRASKGNTATVFGVSVGYFGLAVGSNVAASALGQYTFLGRLVSAGLTAGVLPLFGLAFGHLYLERSRNW